jgi:23S rRNA pseudouridine2605 synthase
VVSVDGQPVTRQGVVVDPDAQQVTVRGRPVVPQPRVTLMMHKPCRVLCTASDPEGRPTVYGMMPSMGSRMYTIGRLDWDSEGLLLITSDGEFCHALSHPRHSVAKAYRVWVDATLDRGQLEQSRAGVMSDGELLRALRIRPMPGGGRFPCYEMVLGEGRNRHIRRMMEVLDRRVVRLLRTAIGPLELGRLQPGDWRMLSANELEQLRAASERTNPYAGPTSNRRRTGRPRPGGNE